MPTKLGSELTPEGHGVITKAELLRIIPATCSKCGAKGKIYPYPFGKGAMFCPVCSPAWLESFLEFCTQRESETE